MILDILDYDKDKAYGNENAHTMTVQFADLLLPTMPFDKNGNNDWEESSIRKYLNSASFAERFEEGFRKLLVPVWKKNKEREDTLDTFFLLSKEEVGETRRLDEKYRRIKTEKDRVKTDEKRRTEWHWLRSAYRGGASFAWVVGSSGGVQELLSAKKEAEEYKTQLEKTQETNRRLAEYAKDLARQKKGEEAAYYKERVQKTLEDAREQARGEVDWSAELMAMCAKPGTEDEKAMIQKLRYAAEKFKAAKEKVRIYEWIMERLEEAIQTGGEEDDREEEQTGSGESV